MKNIVSLEKAIKEGVYENWSGEESNGMILEVDLEYPDVSNFHIKSFFVNSLNSNYY